MTKNNRSSFAFTLIELIVVIIIIGILASVAVPSYSSYVKQAKDRRNQDTVKLIQNVLDEFELYYGYHPSYLSGEGLDLNWFLHSDPEENNASIILLRYLVNSLKNMPMNAYCNTYSEIGNMYWEQIVPSDNSFPYGGLLLGSNWKPDQISGIIFSYTGSGANFEITNIQIDEAAAASTSC